MYENFNFLDSRFLSNINFTLDWVNFLIILVYNWIKQHFILQILVSKYQNINSKILLDMHLLMRWLGFFFSLISSQSKDKC